MPYCDETACYPIDRKYLSRVPFLELVSNYKCTYGAFANRRKVVFMDIQMPDLTACNCLNSWKENKIIFTTAYPQFAIQSYEVDAVDYLLKPFEFERFTKRF
jgi:DNA-binding LytR/AlgR family response regulator